MPTQVPREATTSSRRKNTGFLNRLRKRKLRRSPVLTRYQGVERGWSMQWDMSHLTLINASVQYTIMS